MNLPERPERDKPLPRPKSQRQNVEPAKSRALDTENTVASANLTAASGSRINTGPRIWLLPTMSGSTWAVSEETDATALARDFSHGPPVLISALKDSSEEQYSASACAREHVDERLQDRIQESLFVFISRMALSIAWILSAIVSMRIPQVEFLGAILLALGTIFLIYTIIRHGLSVVRWHHWRVDMQVAFTRPHWQNNALVARLADALALRKKLDHEQRGQLPDDELLDSNAYKKLLRESIVAPKEFIALGRALEQRLKLKQEPKLSEMAKDAGLDTETALFYRDLANAAADIRLDPEFA